MTGKERSEFEVTVEQEIAQVEVTRPHVVILGAGASYAATPSGDENGKRLPLMNNLIEILGLEKVIRSSGYSGPLDNFEFVYGDVAGDAQFVELRAELEKRVYEYFSKIALPNEVTVYDQLVLSLRGKDLIATFNWDPMLCQAYERNRHVGELPALHFLHGNVMAAYCTEHLNVVGGPGTDCPKCAAPLTPTKLLYPVQAKNYALDPFGAREWRTVRHAVTDAFMLTVFGYGAPTSDVDAVGLLQQAWASNRSREIVETEIIDIKPEDELTSTWKPFLYSHHYLINTRFDESWIAAHPRRSCEAMFNVAFEGKFVDENRLPKTNRLEELQDWYGRLLDAEHTNRPRR